MQARGRAWVWFWFWGAVAVSAPVSASEPPRREDASHPPRGFGVSDSPVATQSLYGVSVLVTTVQGSESVSAERRERVVDAVGRALESHGYTMDVSQALLGQAVVACQSSECIDQTLDAAAAELAIGFGAATKGAGEQLNAAAVAGWSAVGAAALAGGIAWWVVGAKRRKQAPTITLHPTGVDLSLRF